MSLCFAERINWHSPVIGSWFLPLPRFELRAEKCALLLIDLQNYVANPEVGYGPLLQSKAPELAMCYFARLREVVISANQRLLDYFRHHKLRVLFTRVGPQLANGSDLIPRRQRRDQEQMDMDCVPALWPLGTYEHAIIKELAPRSGEYIFDKNSSSAFNSTAMDQILWNMGVEDLVTTGVATDMCVDTTARDAADKGFNVAIVEDGTATFEAISHAASLHTFAKTYGMVRSSEEVISILERGCATH